MLNEGLAAMIGIGSGFTTTGIKALSLQPERVLVTTTEYVVLTTGEIGIMFPVVFPFDHA
jgi:hypothetical protein